MNELNTHYKIHSFLEDSYKEAIKENDMNIYDRALIAALKANVELVKKEIY